MEIKQRITDFSLRHYKGVTIAMAVVTVGLGALIPLITVDTDPENMLAETEAVRVFHHETKERFTLSDFVVLGIVNEDHPQGVFNAATLKKIYELTQFAKTLRWDSEEKPGRKVGVVEVDIIAPSEVDHIQQGDRGR